MCARETPCEARTRAIGCTPRFPCLYTDTIHCPSFLCLPRTVRVSSALVHLSSPETESRERDPHTHSPTHTQSARGRARALGSLEGSVCPRSSRFAPPSRISGSKRTAERRKVARRQLPLTTRAPGWLALGSSLRQQGGRRVQIDRRAVKVWRVLGGGTAPVSH